MTSVVSNLPVVLRRSLGLALALASIACAGTRVEAATLPEIRTTVQNAVPACVTPDRLMQFLKRRNDHLDRRFRDIAFYYKRHGEAWGVRWDYAFFQMAIETNFLTYRAPSGRMGDVDPKQNNFAGIGTTGGGVPGDSFPDVSTGVLGQIQHLVVYSGEMIPNPVAPRTQLKQEHILVKSRELNRPVRFSDLAKRWAADPKYGGSIEWVAERYRAENCGPGRAPPERPIEVLPWQQKPPGRSTETKGSPAGGGHAEAAHVSDTSTVRTVWSRDGARAATAAAASSPPREVVAVATKTQPSAAQDSVAVTARVPETPSTAASPETPAVEEEARFALFVPPSGLAGARLPEAKATAAPPQPASRPVAASTVPPEAPVPMADARVATGHKATFDPIAMPRSGLGVKPGRCVVETAKFGGETTVLVKAAQGDDVHYVAVSVIAGFEDSMTQSFLSARPEGGEALGTFETKDAALVRARQLCPAE